MAIDTAAKRASALGVAFVAATFIIPDGTIDQGNRQTIAHSYSGILAASPSPIDTPASRTASANTSSREAAALVLSREAAARSSSRIAPAQVF